MQASEIGQIVDKIAGKLGVAADKLQPLGEEVVRQVMLRGMVLSAIGVAMLTLSAVSGAIAYRKRDGDANHLMPFVMACLFSAFLGALLLGNGVPEWIAPLPTILGL